MKKFQELTRTRSVGSGNFSGRGRRAGVLRFCRGIAAGLSSVGGDVRRHARRRIGAPAAADRTLPAEVWRAHSFDSPAGRARIRGASRALADSSAAHRRGPQGSQHDGSGDAPVLRKGRGAHPGRQHPAAARRSCSTKNASTKSALRNWTRRNCPANVKEDEERAQRRLFVLQIVQPGLAGLMDGSVSTLAPVFAAAFATQEKLGCFPGGAGGVVRRGHQHGICRGAVG